MSIQATIPEINEVAIIGKEIDDDGEVVFLYRKSAKGVDQDRFGWFAFLNEERLAELLDEHGALVVHWEATDDFASVYLIPKGIDVGSLHGQPHYQFPSLEMSML